MVVVPQDAEIETYLVCQRFGSEVFFVAGTASLGRGRPIWLRELIRAAVVCKPFMTIGSAAQVDQMQLLVLRLAARLAVTLQDHEKACA
jgi:hypothetical protein